MKKSIALLIVVATVALAVPAFAELQNVVVGGQIRIRSNYTDYGDTGASMLGRWRLFGPRHEIWSLGANSDTFTEQRTRLNVRADFTDNVSAFIELDSYGNWGEGFRSNYLTGVDSRPTGDSSVEVYQAYIEAKEIMGTALKARIGRQEIKLGSGWLVGTGEKAPYFYGLSFDAVRLTYATDKFSVDAIAAKLKENSPTYEDGDTDLYGLYASYLGIENITLDAYALMIRDASLAITLDTYTFGLRGAGTFGAIDFDAEAAYQYLNWDHTFANYNSTDYFAATAEVGYTFDMTWTPRPFVAGAFFEGDEKGSFNRLFSDKSYSKVIEGSLLNGKDMTNFWTAVAGVSAMPTETIKLQLSGSYMSLFDERGRDASLGWELDASVVYNYTQDLAVKAGYSHLFVDDSGSLQGSYGTTTLRNSALMLHVDDINYFYVETKLSF